MCTPRAISSVSSRASNAVVVSNGLFTVTLDFGTGVFNGDARWLDIAVKTNSAGGFTTLMPRQPLTPSPYVPYVPPCRLPFVPTLAYNERVKMHRDGTYRQKACHARKA